MKRYSKLLFLLLICLLVENSYGQRLDSLQQSWAEITDDSIRFAQQTESAWYYYDNGNYEAGKKLALSNMLEIDKHYFPDLARKSRVQSVFLDFALGNIDQGMEDWQRTYDEHLAVGDTRMVASLLMLKGGQYVNELRYDDAYIIYQEALHLTKDANYLEGESAIYNDIAIIFAEQGLLDKARASFLQAVLTSIKVNDTISVFFGYNNIARSFTEIEQLDSASYYLNKAKEWMGPAKEKPYFTIYYVMRGRLAIIEKDFPKALTYYHRALSFQSMRQEDLTSAYSEIGEIHLELSNYDSALYYLNQAAEFSQKARTNVLLKDILPLQAKSYAALNDWKNAYTRADLAITLRDTFLKEEVQRQVAEMEAKYQLGNLRTKALEQEAKVERQTLYATIGFLCFALISLVSLFVIKRSRQTSILNQALEDKVASRTQELADANEKLKEYLKDLQMFTHITSHDLKEPLRNISGFSSLLERRLKGQFTEDTETFLGMIKTNAVQMHRLIEGIQLYASIDPQGEGKPPMEDVALMEIMQQVQETLASSIHETGAEIIYPDDLPVVQSVSYALMIVLKNLVENGIKYNRSSPPRIEVSYEQQAAHHYISVKDNGIGIAPDYKEQVFLMFQRLHSRQDFSGTGMGLGISRKLIRRFDGDITLVSEEGKGSCFTVVLPLRKTND